MRILPEFVVGSIKTGTCHRRIAVCARRLSDLGSLGLPVPCQRSVRASTNDHEYQNRASTLPQ